MQPRSFAVSAINGVIVALWGVSFAFWQKSGSAGYVLLPIGAMSVAKAELGILTHPPTSLACRIAAIDLSGDHVNQADKLLRLPG